MVHVDDVKPFVRVRFAPSPTGHLHIGGLRTAFFNWLFARHEGGVFLIRIEDTDRERSLPEYTQSILESFKWAGIESDEPLVIQSEREPRHREVAQRLLVEGKLYKCYCTPDELRERLGSNASTGESYTQYDGYCRSLPDRAGVPFALRFKIPDDIHEISFHDLIRGDVTFNRDQFDDFIIVRSDGSPMYNFVVVVDDADMAITHVIRGEDHISNTPKQIMLYRACGFEVPHFAHLPMILGPEGNRLSKRDAATSVLDYKRNGFLADALCNYLVRLGWSHGDQETFTRDELINLFTLEAVGKKGSIFDIKKLEWMNGMYMRSLAPNALLQCIEHDVLPGFIEHQTVFNREQMTRLVGVYVERAKTLQEIADSVLEVSSGPTDNELSALRDLPAQSCNFFKFLIDLFERDGNMHVPLTKEVVAVAIKTLCDHFGIKIPEVAVPLRIALTGKTSSPSIYELVAALGSEVVVTRLRRACAVWE